MLFQELTSHNIPEGTHYSLAAALDTFRQRFAAASNTGELMPLARELFTMLDTQLILPNWFQRLVTWLRPDKS